jgi:hypothetical protein
MRIVTKDDAERMVKSEITMGRLVFAVLLAFACISAAAQDTPAPPPSTPDSGSNPALTRRGQAEPIAVPAKPETMPLIVPKGTALQVALGNEVRVQKVGQPIQGHIVEPVYAFDRLVVPVGSDVNGQITEIEPVSVEKRTLDALDANFTPAHRISVQFTELILANGEHIPIRTVVTPGSGAPIRFITAADENHKGVKDAASQKAREAKQQAKAEWNTAMQQVKQRGKIHKIERYAISQLPVHPQYVDAGTVYFAELQDPLSFGTERLSPELAASVGTAPPPGSFVHARLVTSLSSATSHNGDEVEAVIARPLFDDGRLIYPQGTLLKGTVLQARPAGYMSRSGQLRIVFHDVVLQDGVAGKIQASLEGVQSASAQNLVLDAEGGAKANPPKTRFLTTTISVGLGAASFLGDTFGDTGPRAAGGANGFKLVGIAVGLTVHSTALGMAMGALGAARSVYTNFIARGRDVVFPKNTAMQIGVGIREERQAKPVGASSER